MAVRGQAGRRGARAAMLAGLMVLAACTPRPPDLSGVWKNNHATLTITQDGKAYEIRVTDPQGLLGGAYQGIFERARLNMTGPMASLCGPSKYEERELTLYFCNEPYQRVKPPG
jgi:hypothetical protein